MSMTRKLGRWLIEPLIDRVEHHNAHKHDHRAQSHDGSSWRKFGAIGENVIVHEMASAIVSRSAGEFSVGDFSRIYGQIWLFGDSRFSIGDHSSIGPGSRVWCSNQIRIGRFVQISHLVDIHDGDSHSLHWQRRRDDVLARIATGVDTPPKEVESAPVTIDDDVWIGLKSTILKGVTVGRGAIVAAGSVVTKDVEPFTLVAGNPARVIKELPR